MLDFFATCENSNSAEVSVYSTVFIFLFMEPIGKKSSQSKTNRILVMAKLLSLAMATGSKNLVSS